MKIVQDQRITNAAHAQLLPPSWGTLYELTKLDDAAFEAKIADGTIRPDLERYEIAPADAEKRRRRQRGSEVCQPGPVRMFPGWHPRDGLGARHALAERLSGR